MTNLSDMAVATPIGSDVESVEKSFPVARGMAVSSSVGTASFEEHSQLMVDRPLFVRRARPADKA